MRVAATLPAAPTHRRASRARGQPRALTRAPISRGHWGPGAVSWPLRAPAGLTAGLRSGTGGGRVALT